MNTNMKRTLMALAVTALFGASAAYAHDDGNSNGGNSVTIKKHISLSSDVKISGDPTISGAISVNSAAIALENGLQSTQGNWVINAADTSNNSSISGNVGQNSSGNVGANVAAGDDNSQANAAALATSVSGSGSGSGTTANCQGQGGCGGQSGSGSSAGEMADAEAFADQSVAFNVTANFGTSNNASVSGNAFDGASGNIGVNVASGDDNEQLNGLAASTTDDNVYSTATASTNQQSQGNATLNGPYCDTSTSNNASLSGNAFEGATGNIGVNVAAGTGNMQANTLAVAAATK